MSTRVIHQSNSIRIAFSGGGGDSTIVIAFPFRHQRPSFEHPPFGEEFLAKIGLPALLVTTSENHGFLNDDAKRMIAPVRAATKGFRSVVAYGSSMGGFAAILLSRALQVDRIVAVSPRFTGAWDENWQRRDNLQPHGEVAGLVDRMAAGVRPEAAAVVFYDPTVTLDRVTAESALRRSLRPAPVLLPFAGHPAGLFLSQAKLLARVMKQALTGQLDVGAARREVRAARADVPAYWMNRTSILSKRGADFAASAARAAELGRDDARVHYALAKAFLRRNQPDAAVTAFARAAALVPETFKYHFEHAQALLKLRDWPAALAVLREAVQLPAGAQDFRPQLGIARAHAQLGQDAEAVQALRAAKRLRAPPQELARVVDVLLNRPS